MKAITVWQPWATLLATGQKHNETRSWKTSYRGEILIHAAKTDHSGILLHIPMEELKHFQKAGVVNELPTGVIVGKANLVDCFQIDEAYRRKLQGENPAELLSKSGHSSPSSYSVSHPYASAMKLSQCHPLRCPVSHDGLWCRQFPQQHFSSSFILYISFPVPQSLLSLYRNWLIEQYCICHYPCVPADGIISEC